MANTYTKMLLSGATNGVAIPIATAASLGTLIHTAIASTTALDEVSLFAINPTTGQRKLVIEWGNTGASYLTVGYVPPQCFDYFLVAGRLINNALTITAYSDVAGMLSLHGFVNRIT
jgi:hypothetical protein